MPASLLPCAALTHRAKGPSVILACVVSMLALASCRGKDAPSRGGGEDGPARRQIAFVSVYRDGNAEIYVVNADGSGLRNLTNHPAADESPVWSRDGTRLAFLSNRERDREIFVMNADGSGVTRLIEHPPWGDRLPVNEMEWSPDGTRIAFVPHTLEIYVVHADGSGLRRLTTTPGPHRSPTWSPDGTRIAFVRDTLWHDEGAQEADVMTEIYVVNADGSGLGRLTSPGLVQEPAWSPDGTKLAFVCGEGICVVNADGSGRRDLSTETARDYTCPAWSPDGTRVAFHARIGLGNPQIWVVNADGSGATPLADGRCPAWSPDGTSLAYESCCGADGIWVVDASGPNPPRRSLTDGGTGPSWRPVR